MELLGIRHPSRPIALGCQVIEKTELEGQVPIKQNAKPDVPLGRLMRCDVAKWVLKDHNACQARLGPFDDPCNEPGPGAMVPQRAKKLNGHAKRGPSVAAQEVQWGH